MPYQGTDGIWYLYPEEHQALIEAERARAAAAYGQQSAITQNSILRILYDLGMNTLANLISKGVESAIDAVSSIFGSWDW